MKTRILLTSALALAAVASQAQLVFTVGQHFTNGTAGQGGKQTFTTTQSTTTYTGDTLTGNSNRTAPTTGQPITLNFDSTGRIFNGNPITTVTFNLYFLPTTTGTIKGTVTVNPILIGAGPGGSNVEKKGPQFKILPPSPTTPQLTGLNKIESIQGYQAVVVNGVHYDLITKTFDLTDTSVLPANLRSSYFHFVFDAQFKGATLKMVQVIATPEPASMAALAIGGLGLLRRRRKA